MAAIVRSLLERFRDFWRLNQAEEKKAKNRFFFLVALSQDGGGGGGYGRAADASYILLRVSYNGVNAPYF